MMENYSYFASKVEIGEIYFMIDPATEVTFS